MVVVKLEICHFVFTISINIYLNVFFFICVCRAYRSTFYGWLFDDIEKFCENFIPRIRLERKNHFVRAASSGLVDVTASLRILVNDNYNFKSWLMDSGFVLCDWRWAVNQRVILKTATLKLFILDGSMNFVHTSWPESWRL